MPYRGGLDPQSAAVPIRGWLLCPDCVEKLEPYKFRKNSWKILPQKGFFGRKISHLGPPKGNCSAAVLSFGSCPSFSTQSGRSSHCFQVRK
jgi:hypothetical protein